MDNDDVKEKFSDDASVYVAPLPPRDRLKIWRALIKHPLFVAVIGGAVAIVLGGVILHYLTFEQIAPDPKNKVTSPEIATKQPGPVPANDGELPVTNAQAEQPEQPSQTTGVDGSQSAPITAENQPEDTHSTLPDVRQAPEANAPSQPAAPLENAVRLNKTRQEILEFMDFSLCGHSGFSASVGNDGIRFVNKNREFPFRSGLRNWETTVSTNRPTLLFSGCLVQVQIRSRSGATTFLIDEFDR